MPSKISAGVLVYRIVEGDVQVLLVHPGGPFWVRKDAGAWTIPKGELQAGEEPLAAARRELTEETGFTVEGSFLPLGTVRQAGGKEVHGFAAPGAFDAEKFVSNTFEQEWPPRSGRRTRFPEVDRAAWFPLSAAHAKINPAQRAFLVRLADLLREGSGA